MGISILKALCPNTFQWQFKFPIGFGVAILNIKNFPKNYPYICQKMLQLEAIKMTDVLNLTNMKQF